MPYFLESDTVGDDPIWEVLAGGNADLADRVLAGSIRLKAAASHQLTDGYLTDAAALRAVRGRRKVLDLLATPVLGRAPRLHRPGDDCDCLGEDWTDGYHWRLHKFLRRNPSRSEYNRNRAQKADLRDPRLKALVLTRDGGCCRYCRSGPLDPRAGRARDRRRLLQYDHIDPDASAGSDGANLVTACGRCNEHKGKRTPDEADMVLLPPPTPQLATAWAARGRVLFDPGEYPEDQPQIHRQDQKPIDDRIDVGSTTDRHHDVEHVPDRHPIPIDDQIADGDDVPTGEVRPNQVDVAPDRRPDDPAEGLGQGRGGGRDSIRAPGGPQPARTSDAPDVYTRRSRAPTNPPPRPRQWPAGTFPADLPARASPEELP